MAEKVKGTSRKREGGSRVSSKHQVTIPIEVFRTAGLSPGDTVKVQAQGPGRITLTRLDVLIDKYRGALTPGAITNADVERLRDEWE